MDISVVSGTYNRLPYLQKMVQSVRSSVGSWYGPSYEVVIVDGGSKDGTQDWCKAQSDIRLIEHGSLMGAVKAFNDGAFAATGDYVILANDDIEFIDDSIFQAWRHMQDNLDCGMGCFFQDRGGKGWHVEPMPVVINNQQSSAPYGQVCIVPKWLGDQSGWWGDYLRTYGGDNELASRVYETGFRVTPIDAARIHDSEPDDDLRRINNITGGHDPRAVRGHHPDSWAWGQKWRRQYDGKYLVGPVVLDAPAIPNKSTKHERILYLPIYEQGWEVQKQQKRGLREALARVGIVAEVDYFREHAEHGHDEMVKQLDKLMRKFSPTLVVSQLHNSELLSIQDVRRFRVILPEVPWVNWNGDYWPDNLLTEKGFALAGIVDLQLTVNRSALDEYKSRGINADYWQIGWEPDGIGHEPQGDHERHDVVFLASGYSPARQRLVREIRGFNGLSFGLYGQGWPDGWSKGQCLYDFVTGCRLYRGAKFSIGDSQWPDSGFVSNRVMQALAAGGAVLCHQQFKDMDRLGLVDGQTCVVWYSVEDLRNKLYHYANHEDERRRIAEAGERLALERHSFDVRVGELFSMLGKQVTVRQDERRVESDDCYWRW